MTSLILNKTKTIGQVIYIVEGDKTEPELIEKIYTLLGYSVVTYHKFSHSCTCLEGYNRYSRVFIIPAAHSTIVKLSSDQEYFDEVYRLLAINYGLDVENSAIFYLFDRDRGSNRPRHIIPEIEKYGNSRVSFGFDMNGLFLLSYPSIEAFLLSARADDVELGSGDEAKKYVVNHNYNIKDLNVKELLSGTLSMIEVIEQITCAPFDAELLDSFSVINKTILSFQENKWAREHRYKTLSLLSASLIDLGIITLV